MPHKCRKTTIHPRNAGMAIVRHNMYCLQESKPQCSLPLFQNKTLVNTNIGKHSLKAAFRFMTYNWTVSILAEMQENFL